MSGIGGPIFKIQIVNNQGEVVRLPGGGNPPQAGTLERNLIDEILKQVKLKDGKKRRIGFFSSEAAVEAAIVDGIERAFQELKNQTIYAAR